MKAFKGLQPRFILAGGSTAGPMVPLLAVREEILDKHPEAEFIVVDVPGSVGELLAHQQRLRFVALRTGKLRRYFSWRTVFTPFLVATALIRSLLLLRRERITGVLGAGGFVQVPLIWAAWLLRIRRHIHQQDVTPTLANSLCAPVASSISVTFASSQRDFFSGSGLFASESERKITLTGNPCRKSALRGNKAEAQAYFQLEKSWPTLYIVGGGSGAQGINALISQALPELSRTVQIIHSTGRGKGHKDSYERYHVHEFISRVDLAYAAADVVIARAGIGTITELSAIGKPSIIIPMPASHQEANARLLYEQQAAVVLDQTELTPEHLVRTIRRLLLDLPLQESLRENVKKIMPHNAAAAIAKIISHE